MPTRKPSRPPSPRGVAAYVLGYTMWGTTLAFARAGLPRPALDSDPGPPSRGRLARQYGLASARLWHDRRMMRFWQDGHNDAADGRPLRWPSPAPVRPAAPETQLALLEVPHAQP